MPMKALPSISKNSIAAGREDGIVCKRTNLDSFLMYFQMSTEVAAAGAVFAIARNVSFAIVTAFELMAWLLSIYCNTSNDMAVVFHLYRILSPLVKIRNHEWALK